MDVSMTVLGLTWSGWLLWLAILVGITTRCLNMWSYGADGWLVRFRHDGRLFRTVMPLSGLVIGTLAWSWGTYGSAAANLVLALATLRPDLVRRQRWLATALGSPAGMAVAFVVVPVLIVAVTSGSFAERIQLAGGYQLITGFLAMLAGAWDGERSADTWRWLLICLSVDAMLGFGAVALAAVPIIALEVLALTLDLAKLTRKVTSGRRHLITRPWCQHQPDRSDPSDLRSWVASGPDPRRGLDDESQLGPLLVLGQRVALDGAREAALRAEAQPVEGDVRVRLADTSGEVVGALELGTLARDQAEDDDLVVRDEPQRSEVAGALVVVLEEVGIDGQLREQDLGDRLVAALREPRAAVVAPTQVHGDDEVVRSPGQHLVDQRGVGAGELVGVVTTIDRALRASRGRRGRRGSCRRAAGSGSRRRTGASISAR